MDKHPIKDLSLKTYSKAYDGKHKFRDYSCNAKRSGMFEQFIFEKVLSKILKTCEKLPEV